jgi:hypothetical protein
LLRLWTPTIFLERHGWVAVLKLQTKKLGFLLKKEVSKSTIFQPPNQHFFFAKMSHAFAFAKLMTWGGTKKKVIKTVTLETGDMPQKVLFGPIQGRWLRHPVIFFYIANLIFKTALGSCIKVVKQKKMVSF